MALTQQVRLSTAKGDAQGQDLVILFGYAFFAVLLMVEIYFAAGGPGVAPGDFVTMGAFP